MIKQALNILFKQQPWAKTIHDYARDTFAERGIPWKMPVGADVIEGTLVVIFPEDEQWCIKITSEKV